MSRMLGVRDRASQETLRSTYTARQSISNERDTRYRGAVGNTRPSCDSYAGSSRRLRASHEQARARLEPQRPSIGSGRPSIHHEGSPMLNPALSSMLKTTTETGDLGMYSIHPKCQANAMNRALPSSRPMGNHIQPLQSLNNRHMRIADRVPGEIDDRRRLPSYMRDTTSEIVSMYQTAEQKAGARSYSMTQPNRASYAEPKHHRSYTSLRSQAESAPISRPRSPYVYPTRFRRPDYRPSSPAVTECGSVDYGRRSNFNMSEAGTGRSSPASMYGRRRRPALAPLASRSDVGSSSLSSNHYPSAYQEVYGRRVHEQTRDWAYRDENTFHRASPALSVQSSVSMSNIHQVNGVPVSRVQTHGIAYEPPPLYYDYSEDFAPTHVHDYVDENVISPTFSSHTTIPEDHEITVHGAEVDRDIDHEHEMPELSTELHKTQEYIEAKKLVQSVTTVSIIETAQIPPQISNPALKERSHNEAAIQNEPDANIEAPALMNEQEAFQSNSSPSLHQKESNSNLSIRHCPSLSRSSSRFEKEQDQCHAICQAFSEDHVRDRQIGGSSEQEEIVEDVMVIDREDSLALKIAAESRRYDETTDPAITIVAMNSVPTLDVEHTIPRPTSAQDCRVRSTRFMSSHWDPALKEYANITSKYEAVADDFDASRVLQSARNEALAPIDHRTSRPSASLIKFKSEENLRACKRKIVAPRRLETVVDEVMIKREHDVWRDGERLSARSETPLIAPVAISPGRQIRLKTSIPRLMKALPLLPPPKMNGTGRANDTPSDVSKTPAMTLTSISHPAVTLIKSHQPAAQLRQPGLISRSSASSHARPSAETRPWNIKENYTWMTTPDVHLNSPKQDITIDAGAVSSERDAGSQALPFMNDDMTVKPISIENKQSSTAATRQCQTPKTKSTIDRMFRKVGQRLGGINAGKVDVGFRDRRESPLEAIVTDHNHCGRSVGEFVDQSQLSYDTQHLSQPLLNAEYTGGSSRFSEDSLQARQQFQAPLRTRLSRIKSKLHLTHTFDTVFGNRRHDTIMADGRRAMSGAGKLSHQDHSATDQAVQHDRFRERMKDWYRETRAVLLKSG